MIHELFTMEWPFAMVLIAVVLACVVVYGIRKGG